MIFQIDEATLAAMTQEARQCFLDEDAPDYMRILELALQQPEAALDYKALLRAAHSLKGGAGLAQLPSVRELAHQLEDLLQSLQKGTVTDTDWTLLEWSVSEMGILLSQAQTSQNVSADPSLLQALSHYTTAAETEQPPAKPTRHEISSLTQKALNEDLESCFVRMEALSTDEPFTEIEIFVDECLLLGETLDLPWLMEGIKPLEVALDEGWSDEDLLELAHQIIIHLRQERQQYLEGSHSIKVEKSQDIVSPPEETVAIAQLRVPLPRLENMTHQVEELLLTQERLRLEQQQLGQSLSQLRQLAQQFEPIREQVQTLYDQLAIAPLASPLTPTDDTLNFDAVELDRFTEFHSTLQSFQELMLQVQETRSDLDLVNREFAEDLEHIQHNLDGLYSNVTASRLVPFRLLAQRFIPQIQYLNRRYDKSVNLIIEGEESLIDQVILEQLQTPLTHLINNAFDHGIELPSERIARQKPETAQILLKATVENNFLVIQIIDNGRGIQLEKVYQKAVQCGLCHPEIPFTQLTQSEILNWIFQPNFSTAATISDLSGRGVGLDIVRTQVQRLRGTLHIETTVGQQTGFTLKLPLNLSLSSLLFVRWQEMLLAFPSHTIKESFPYAELKWASSNHSSIYWREQIIPLVSLSQLLPYARSIEESVTPQVALVIETGLGLLMITVDALLNERQVVVKPFDDTVMLPPYLAGCTILGKGEIVPVILPHNFNLSSSKIPTLNHLDSIFAEPIKPTIFVVEDSVATRRLLEKLLTKVGYSVILCRDGQEALDALDHYQGHVNLIISDIEMPRLNGFELLQKLRSHPMRRQIPVIMATSRTGERHQKQAMDLGANAYLGKPLQPQELLTTISQLIQVNR